MGILEQILENQKTILDRLNLIENRSVEDTSLIDTKIMIKELAVSISTFNNVILPILLSKNLVKKFAGRYKIRRCDFEKYKEGAFS